MSSWITAISLTAGCALISPRFAGAIEPDSTASRFPKPKATVTLAGGLWDESLAQAQPAKAQRIFENVTIGAKFSPDPMIVRGISGGSIAAAGVASQKETPTGPCVGFVDEPPDHTINLTSFLNYLSLQVESPEDTTLVISGPGGTWCNDDLQGKNPGVAGQWLAGTYRVWVGSYKQNNYHPYIIRISEVQGTNPTSQK